MFKDREHAGTLLAEKLAYLKGKHVVVFAIPRGAIRMAEIIARKIEGRLDVVLVHKVGAPQNKEYAIGSVDEAGDVFMNPTAGDIGISGDYLRAEADRELKRIRERRILYSVPETKTLKGKIAVIVDDGIATGSTVLAAIRSLKNKNPEKIIVATAVAPSDTVALLAREADEVVVLDTPYPFNAVGAFFGDFGQVEDEEVIRILKHAHERRG